MDVSLHSLLNHCRINEKKMKDLIRANELKGRSTSRNSHTSYRKWKQWGDELQKLMEDRDSGTQRSGADSSGHGAEEQD